MNVHAERILEQRFGLVGRFDHNGENRSPPLGRHKAVIFVTLLHSRHVALVGHELISSEPIIANDDGID